MTKTDTKKKIEEIVEKVRIGLQMDGGDMELVSYNDEIVTLRFQGACVGCPLSQITYNEYIEKEIKTHVPSVKEVKMLE